MSLSYQTPCEYCEDAGFITVYVNERASRTRPCEVCNPAWSRTSTGKIVEQKKVNMHSYPQDPFYRYNQNIPSTVWHNQRKGTCLLDSSGSHGEDNLWHVELKVPEGANRLFNLKELPKYKDVDDPEKVFKTNVPVVDLFKAIIRRLDYQFPLMKSDPKKGECGMWNWQTPDVEIMVIERLARQLKCPVRVTNFHKAKNCPKRNVIHKAAV